MECSGSGSRGISSKKAVASLNLSEQVPWEMLCSCVEETFRFTEAEAASFRSNRTAHLIGALPYAAGCDEPDRTALAHLTVYMTELRGGRVIFDHTQADNADVLARLRLIMSFKGGNPQVIDHGMQQLALIMIQGYERSQEGDRHRGVYNPLHDGSWDAPSLKAYLIRAINGFPCELLDSIMPVSMDDPLPSWC